MAAGRWRPCFGRRDGLGPVSVDAHIDYLATVASNDQNLWMAFGLVM
jgi:hypothetical protein